MGILACFGAMTSPFRSKRSVERFPPPYGAFRPYLAFEPVEEFTSGTHPIPRTAANDSLGSSLSLTLVPSRKTSPDHSLGSSMDLSVEHLSGSDEGATFVTRAQIHRSASEDTLVPNPSLCSSVDLMVSSLKSMLDLIDRSQKIMLASLDESEDTLVPSHKMAPNPSLGSSMDLSTEHLSGPYEGATFVTRAQIHRSASEETLVPSAKTSVNPSLESSLDQAILSLKDMLASLDESEDTLVPSRKTSPNPSLGSSMDLSVEHLSGPCEGATFVTRAQIHRSASEDTLVPSSESSPVPSRKVPSLKVFLASLDDRSSVSELRVDQPSDHCEEVAFLSRAELRRVASEFSLECSLTSSSLPTSPVLPPKTGKDPSPGKCGTSSRGRKVWARIRKALTACLCCSHTCQRSEDIPH
jgi:hypothetical protein